MDDLTQLIRGLSPGALSIFKRQISSLPEIEKQRAFSRLSGIPELSDILGQPTLISKTKQITQEQPKPALWQKGLQAFGAPFQWLQEKAIEPFASVATAPFSPTTPETQGLPFFQRELAEYKGWKAPWGVKGAVETLPWFLIPGIGAVAGKGGVVGRGIAGALGRMGPVGKVAGTALEYSPWGLAEKGAGAVLGAVTKPVTPLVGKVAGKALPKEITKLPEAFIKATEQDIINMENQLVRQVSVVEKARNTFEQVVPSKAKLKMPRTGTEELETLVDMDIVTPDIVKAAETLRDELRTLVDLKNAIAGIKDFLTKAKAYEVPKVVEELSIRKALAEGKLVIPLVTKAVKEILPKGERVIPKEVTPIAKITSELFPEGFNEPQQAAIRWITDAIKEAKPIRGATERLYTKARGEQASAYESAVKRLTQEGIAPREALAEAKKALYMGGELPKAEITTGFTSIADKVTEDIGQTLFSIIRDAPYKSAFDRVNINEALTRLLDPAVAGIPREFELELLEKTFGSELIKEILKKRPLGTRAWELALGIANAPRALLASCDLSGLLRQGGVLVARHPIEGTKTVRPMVKSLFSDKNASLVERIIQERPGMDELLDNTLRVGLYVSPLPTKVAAKLAEREEPFMTTVFNKLGIIKASNRAYVTGLNDLRSRSALNVLNGWKKAGIKYTKDDISDLNQLVNWASGRGTLPAGLSKRGALLNTVFFAPKLIVSRIQLPTTVLPMVTKSALVRREAWRTLLSFIGAGAGILTMAKLAGMGDVELDPRSADFGKLKVGETRLDIWTGYTQYIRFLTQFSTAQRKTVGGRIQQLQRLDVATRFARTKLSPAVGLLTDLVAGETFLGEELPPKSTKGVVGQIYQRMTPLAIQDIIDAVSQDGVLGGVIGASGFIGVGVVTYTDEARRERDKAAKTKYGMTWEEVGLRYGRVTQLKLEQTTPAILEAEKEQEKRFATGTPTVIGQYQKEGQSIEDAYREAIGYAVNKFRQTNDGVQFREDVNDASKFRRTAYGARAKRAEYQDIIAYYNQPLTPEQKVKMNPGDVLRREYNQIMFAPNMYDPSTNEYLFDEAEKQEQAFLVKYGQQALDYIEEYRGASWVNKPAELKMLEEVRELLQPYWQITDNVWAMYPPELKVVADQIDIIDRTNPVLAKQMLRQYPQILRARELISYKKQMQRYNPVIKQAIQLFYS